MWYNGTTLRYLGTLGFAAVVAVIATPAALSSGSASPTKIPIGTTGGILISAYGSAWTTDLTLDRLIRIDPKSAQVSGKLHLGARPYGLASGDGSIWVASNAQVGSTFSFTLPKTPQM